MRRKWVHVQDEVKVLYTIIAPVESSVINKKNQFMELVKG